jgi:tRNA(Ile)-lysidine synthase
VGLPLDRRGTRRLATFTISERRTGSMPLSGGWRVEATRTELVLRRRPARETASVSLPDSGALQWGRFNFRAGPDGVGSEPVARTESDESRGAWTASLPLESPLMVRPWSAGDRLAPAGGQARRRVKRYLTDAGVRGLDRAGWPVVVAGNDVIWIPGVRRSDAATDRSGRPARHYICERLDR